MPQTALNKVRNPQFTLGASAPRHWDLASSTKGARWERVGDARTLRLHTPAKAGNISFSQVVRCKPRGHNRIEVTASCDLRADGERAGLILTVEPMGEAHRTGTSRSTLGLHRAGRPVTVRTYYQTPADVKELRITVGVVNARGAADLHSVRVMSILEPEHAAHVLAIPPPPMTLPAPRSAGAALICSRATGRPITRLLSMVLGDANVRQASPKEFRVRGRLPDALFLPDDKPPAAVRSLKTLETMAAEHIVVISLPAFAEIAGAEGSVRRVEQEEDPIHAAVAYAGWPTRGFALRDAFPYAWSGDAPGSFVQRHFKRTAAVKMFCQEHGLVPLLTSLCDQNVTSDRPVALYRPTPGGGLFVLDIDPIEEEGSTFCEPALGLYLLRNLLGHRQAHLGQYVVPHRSATDFRSSMREMAERFAPFIVHEEDVPVDRVTEQLVTIGRQDDSFGLPLKPKPLILVRSGLVAGDLESVYAALIYFKQLVRMAPHCCPYAELLTSRFRLAWVPLCADWEPGDGWHRSEFCGTGFLARHVPAGKPVPQQTGATSTGYKPVPHEQLAVLIDIVSMPTNCVRVVAPSLDGEYERYATWLPLLAEAFGAGDYFAPTVPDGASCGDRDAIAWRRQAFPVQVVAVAPATRRSGHGRVARAKGAAPVLDPKPVPQSPVGKPGHTHRLQTGTTRGADGKTRSRAGSDDPLISSALQAGAQVLRLELPAHPYDFPAHSIRLTDMGATLLEHVIGLQYGLLAVNRRPTPVQLQNAFPPIAPKEMLAIHREDPSLQALATPTG